MCVWCVVCGVWCVVCGVWCVVCGVWCVVCSMQYVVGVYVCVFVHAQRHMIEGKSRATWRLNAVLSDKDLEQRTPNSEYTPCLLQHCATRTLLGHPKAKGNAISKRMLLALRGDVRCTSQNYDRQAD